MYSIKKYVCKELYEDLQHATDEHFFDQVTNRKLLITGGSGFIAYYLTLTLLALNDEKNRDNTVYLLVRNEKRARAKYGELLNRHDLKLIVQDVCEKFDINEKWLRDGDGPKKREKTEFDELAYMMGALFAEDNQFKVKIIKALLSLEDEDWYFIEKLINKFTK